MDETDQYKGWSFEPASDKLLSGKYFPRGQIVKKVGGDQGKIMKTFDGEYSTKEEADAAFIEFAKQYIDITYSE